tara:strand:- start:34057 stop:34401 length:345 start_codon:yes stop_codon:yes gene_type:complete
MTPNVRCTVSKAGEPDIYGQYTMSDPVDALCAVVSLNIKSLKTSVRADSSASRGTAKETISESKLLFSTGVDVTIGDKVTLNGLDLEVSEIEMRYDVSGNYDHNEIGLIAWQSR